jgi:Cdc6-like AAA superfamily ATPase
MVIDPWLPIGQRLPDNSAVRAALYGGEGWQIFETEGDGRALLVRPELAARWTGCGLLGDEMLRELPFGERTFRFLASGALTVISPVDAGRAPSSKSDALAFAIALKATRAIDRESPLHDAIYVESASRLLPTYSISAQADDDVVLGKWLTGGAAVSATSFRRLSQILSWMAPTYLKDVVDASGLLVKEGPGQAVDAKLASQTQQMDAAPIDGDALFRLPGRPVLEAFINEYIVDIIRNRARYEALGIGFPSAMVLEGPPGTGKTFAVEKLVAFLGWPSFQIDASSVASPYIHETSRKIAAAFDQAMASAPSVLVIDEMEAFLADREQGIGSSHHRVEEVAEFLRRIPEATKNRVLIVGMTNRIDMIDPAILRRGRFDHVIKLDYATETEVRFLLETMLRELPTEGEIDCAGFARQLIRRPLSDVAFLVREGARLAARAGHNALDAESLAAALKAAPSRTGEEDGPKIGFRVG